MLYSMPPILFNLLLNTNCLTLIARLKYLCIFLGIIDLRCYSYYLSPNVIIELLEWKPVHELKDGNTYKPIWKECL